MYINSDNMSSSDNVNIFDQAHEHVYECQQEQNYKYEPPILTEQPSLALSERKLCSEYEHHNEHVNRHMSYEHLYEPVNAQCLKYMHIEQQKFTANVDMCNSNCFCAVCLYWRVYKTCNYNHKQARIPIQTTLNIAEWIQRLSNYHDKVICEYLEFGWPINYCNQTLPVYDVDNHPSVDLSFPLDNSVNSGILRDSYLGEDFHLRYPTVDSLAELVRNEGRGCYMYKCDLSRAYRQIPVEPIDYALLGFRWRSKYYIDTRLPFGLASAAMACQRTTKAVAYMFENLGLPLINYLDDLASAKRTLQDAISAFYQLKQLLSDLGLQESALKAVFPTQIMIFLGVLFNSVTMTMEVTPDRLEQILSELSKWDQKVFASKREIQQLIGKLQFIAKCVKPGRLFIARMLDTLRSISHNQDKIRLSTEFRADVFWWQKFIECYNGVSIIGDIHFSKPGSISKTDACLVGCGGICNNECFSRKFPQFITEMELDINSLELLTIVVACKIWGHKWSGLRIVVQCDSEVSANIINHGRSRSVYLNKCARELLYVAANFEFDIRACHVLRSNNTCADQLNKGKLSLVLQQFPDMISIACPDTYFHFQHDW